jgi:hypothetical protein
VKLQLSELTTEGKWRAATGLNEERFYKLLERFKVAYEELYKKSIEQEAEKHFDFCLSEELLYFTLLKSGLTNDCLVCGMNKRPSSERFESTSEGTRRIYAN